MGERASVFNEVRIGSESTPGTAVAATKLLASLDVVPSPKFTGVSFRPIGQKFATLMTPGRNWTEAKVTGNPTFGELPYLLCSLLKKVTPTADGATAKLWTITPSATQEDTPATYSVEMGSAIRVAKFAYGLINSGTFTFNTQGVSFDGSMLGQYYTDDTQFSADATYTLTANATPPTSGNYTLTLGGQTTSNIAYNATPATVQAALEALSTVGAGNVKVFGTGLLSTANNVFRIEFVRSLGNQAVTLTGTFTSLVASGSIALASAVTGVAVANPETTPVPVPGSGITVTLADTWAGLSGASVTAKVISATLAIQDHWSPFWYMDSSKTSFGGHVEKAPNATLKLLMEADANGMGLLTTMRAGSQKFIRINCAGPNIATTYDNLFQINVCGVIPENGMGELKDEDGVYAVEWTFNIARDASSNSLQAVVRNALASL